MTKLGFQLGEASAVQYSCEIYVIDYPEMTRFCNDFERKPTSDRYP